MGGRNFRGINSWLPKVNKSSLTEQLFAKSEQKQRFSLTKKKKTPNNCAQARILSLAIKNTRQASIPKKQNMKFIPPR